MPVCDGNISGALSVKTTIILVLLIFFAVFVMQNTSVVDIKFLFWKVSMSRVLLLLGALLVGLLIGLLTGWEISSKKASKPPRDTI